MGSKNLILALILIFSGNSFSQTNPDAIAASEYLYSVYMTGDLDSIKGKWNLDEDEFIDFSKLLLMQRDAYGSLRYPSELQKNKATSFDFEQNHFVIYRGVLSVDSNAYFSFATTKGKKKNDPHYIESIDVTSESESPIKFIDSLASPYIDLIVRKELDSLMGMVFPKSYVENINFQVEQIKSKKKRKKARSAFYRMVNETSPIVRDSLSSIDPNREFDYTSNDLQLRFNIPILRVAYSFQTSSGNEMKVFLNFQRQDENYQLVTIGCSGLTLANK